MKFTKMHGLGNDYVYVNCFEERVANPVSLARAISDRHRGVGADGLILICPSQRADVRMEMYNADGSRAQTCGNGIRCVAKYAYERGLFDRRRPPESRSPSGPVAAWAESRANSDAGHVLPFEVESDAGLHPMALLLDADRKVAQVCVDMGPALLRAADLPCTLDGERIVDRPVEIAGAGHRITCVSMGNPHVVIFVDDLEAVDLATEGPRIETAPIFPQRANVHFARVLSRSGVRMKTWERGAGATQACGTGACAVGVAAVLAKDAHRDLTVELPGGYLAIAWRPDGHVYMTGPAVEVFTGDWP